MHSSFTGETELLDTDHFVNGSQRLPLGKNTSRVLLWGSAGDFSGNSVVHSRSMFYTGF